jgi:TonB family protein
MSSAAVEPERWGPRRWWSLVVLVFIVQLALIFWLGDISLPQPRPAARAFTLGLVARSSAQSLALHDPTLFVLPHPQGFAGPALPEPPRQEFHAFAWPEPVNHLRPPADQPVSAFNRFVQTNDFNPRLPSPAPEPRLTVPNLPALAIAARHSSLRLEGALAHRRLATSLHLLSWTNPVILTNSVVRVAVDAEGTARSWTLLSGSGYPLADEYAVEQAKTARFEPLIRGPGRAAADPAAQLSWGRMVFEWHTVAPQPTNSRVVSP